MAKTSSMYIRIDPVIKSEVEKIYNYYGMSLSDAINVFIYQSRNVGGLPFDLRLGTRLDWSTKETKPSVTGLRGKYKGVLSTESFMAQKQREKEVTDADISAP